MASSSSEVKKQEPKKVRLKSSDGYFFEIEGAAAKQSQTIKALIEDDRAKGPIPLPLVKGSVLAKVIEYCDKHAASESSGTKEEDLKAWDSDFVKVDSDTLYHLIMAANYLNIKGLLDLICQTVANMIKGKSPDDICKTFKIEKNFTPEEEEEIRRENEWAFQFP